MQEIAIDIVILLPKNISELAISLNRKLQPQLDDQIYLNKNTALPHLSLAMGVIRSADIEQMKSLLADICQTCLPIDLKIIDITETQSSSGCIVTSFKIAKTQKLQYLHKQVMLTFSPFISSDVSAQMLSGDKIAESTLDWIRDYPAKSAQKNFQPHITIGYGKIKQRPPMPIDFAAHRLAICRLGNHCTCAKILAEINSK